MPEEGYEQEKARADFEQRNVADLDGQVWALAYILAEIMDGAKVSDVIDDLPSGVRRKVIAARHSTGPLGRVPPRDQYGRLPRPPSRPSVMRARVKDVDVDWTEATPGSEIATRVAGNLRADDY